MNMPIRMAATATAIPDPAAPLRIFVAEHHEALRCAARLLGGYDAARLVDAIADALARDPVPTRRTHAQITKLIDLLRLEHVQDPDRVEMGFFACLDPGDPAVAEICILVDRLTDAVQAATRTSDSTVRLRPAA